MNLKVMNKLGIKTTHSYRNVCSMDSREIKFYSLIEDFHKVMNQLGLKTTHPFKNVCIMDSREINVCGLIMDFHVKLATYPTISLSMDVISIVVPNPWGMFLYGKCATILGGSI